MNDAKPSCGLFGKLPQQPDFVSRHLPEAFTDHWHHWLQAGMSVSREQLGDAWLDIYLTSPVWHFALGAGICSDRGAVGVMIPSVDEVGRFFPLLLAHVGEHTPWSSYLDAAAWYPQAENVVLSALDENIGYARLIDDVEKLPEPGFRAVPQFRSTLPGRNATRACAVLATPETKPLDAVTGLTEKAYGRLLGPHSLWWTQGSQRVDACLLISAGLPEAGQLAAMFDGEWQRWGWASEQMLTADEAALA